MSKARTLANFVSSGNPLADGAIAASEVTGLSTVATTGAYADLSGKPSLAAVATTGSYTDLSNTPTTIGTANDLSGGAIGSIPYQAGTGDTAMLAAGAAGKVLTSNGAAAPSWETAASSSYRNVLGTSSNITLTTADGGAFITVSSTQSVNITLPAANALTTKTIVLKNVGNFAMLVYDYDGNYLFPLVPNYGVTCWASVATTTAGTWTLGELPLNFVSPSVDVSSTGGVSAWSKQSTTPYSSTQLLVAYSISNSFYITTVTNSSGVLTFSTPQLVLATTSGSSPAIMALSSTLAIMNYGDSSANLYAVAVSISGGTFTAGTPVLVQSTIYGNQMFSMLDANTVALAYISSSSGATIKANILSISGTTITVGTTATIASDSSTNYFGICSVTSSLFAIARYSSNSAGLIMQQCAVSGTTITVRPNSAVFNGGDAGPACSMVAMDSSKVLVIYPDYTTGYLSGRVLNTNGSGWTLNSQTTINSAGNLFRYEICASSSSSFVVAYTDGLPQPLRLRGITTSGTVINSVGSQYISSATGVNQTWYTPWNLQPFRSPEITPSGTSSFVTLYIPQNGLYEQPIGVSGTTLTTTYTSYTAQSSAGVINPSYSSNTTATFSNTRGLVFAGETGNDGNTFLTAYLVDYSTTTPTYLSKLQVAPYSNYMCVTPLTSTTVVVTYQTPSGTICGNVITMSGTSISAGAQATINSATTCNYNAVSALSSSTLVAYYRKTSSVQAANVLTVSGTSITVGTETTVSTSDLNYHYVIGLSATSALVSNQGANIRVLTISGTSISSVSSNQSISGFSSSEYLAAAAINSTTVIFSGVESSGASANIKTSVTTISGSTIIPNTTSMTSELGGIGVSLPILFSANRGILLSPQSNMAISFTIEGNLVRLGNLQSVPCSSGGSVLGNFAVATPNYTKAITINYSGSSSTINSRQLFALGAAN